MALQLKAKRRTLQVENRLTRWEEVKFKPVPTQEGEEGVAVVVDDVEEPKRIDDSLKLSDMDLRLT